MSTTTMHFGPEWMRTKHQPLSRSQPPPSPPPTNLTPASGLSTYSALVSAAPPLTPGSVDVVHPFRYSKEELLKIYQEGGGKGGLGLEVERWEGVVREGGTEPVTLREMTEAEKKLFAGPLNSELRRRPSQSTEYLSPLNTTGLDRARLPHNNPSTTSTNSPLRERFGALKRRDSAASPSDTVLPTIPRKPSLSSLQTPALSPREPPRTRVGYTPGFDGVFNNGDSWVSRKRTSEASAKIGSGSSREFGDTQHDVLVSGIREEREDDNRSNLQSRLAEDENFFSSSLPQVHSTDNHLSISHNESGSQTPPNTYSANGTSNSDPFGDNRSDMGPPPGLFDLAAVEWSYKDPTGQVQGPFRADLMQKWYNDGYFSADLPMKRVRYDTHWTTVEELGQLAKGENIFLSPSLTPNPLGPVRGNASPLHAYPSAENLISEPFQPAPVRSHLTALDSYFTTGSLASDSPSSSVGGSHFGNPSPDPSGFGGRDNKMYFGGDTTGRHSGFGAQDRPSPFSERRAIGQDFQSVSNNLNSPSFGNFPPDRDVGFNTYGFNNMPVVHEAWGMSSNLPSGFAVPPAGDKTFSGSNPSTSNHSQIQRLPETPSNDQTRKFSHETLYVNEDIKGFGGKRPAPPGDGDSTYGHYEFPSQTAFQTLQDQHVPYVAAGQEFSDGRGLGGSYPFLIPNSDPPITQTNRPVHPNTMGSIPWSNVPDTKTPLRHEVIQTPAPLTSANVAASPWNKLEHTVSTPIGLVESVVSEERRDTQNDEVTTAKPTQEIPAQVDAPTPFDQSDSTELNSTSEVLEPAISPVASQPSPTPTPGGKSSKPVAQASTPVFPHQSPTGDSSVTPAVQKVAWVKEEEGKKKSGLSPSVSLREIQEAEAKKLESRKAAERERERLARVSASSEGKDDVQPFTTSWGLPTSQAGTRGAAPIREHLVTPVQTPSSAPVWTTPLKQPVAKKTMKEIQEEEEVRKKMASAKETPAVIAPKRVYADTAIKTVVAPPTLNNGNAWTTVGPSGKTTTASAPSTRPAPHTSSVPTVSTSRPPTSPIPKVATSSMVKKSFPKQDDFPETPSHDFLKWLGDSLKGLNASVNVEEIVSMLLSFPLDPDASTIEIISDTIYSNSTTLDGRRFASEYVAKRKADVLARAKGALSKTPSKPVSIADVVKATPKTAQPEWGFKVVNKKKKGGRS